MSAEYIDDEITGEKEQSIQVKMESAKAPETMVFWDTSRGISIARRTFNHVGRSAMDLELLLRNSTDLAKQRMNIRIQSGYFCL